MPLEKKVKSGAILGFKVGTQSRINTMLAAGASAGADHGTFYLAEDTHRLYVGNEDTSLSPVNEGIITVETMADLRNVTGDAGQFYYVTGTIDQPLNILCVHNGQGWVQINSYEDTYVSDFSYVAVDLSTNDGIEVDGVITNSNNVPKTGRFYIKGENGTIISQSTTNITVGSNTVAVPIITVTGDQYNLSAENTGNVANKAIKLKLDSTNSTNDTFVILQAVNNTLGDDTVSITTDQSGNVQISAQDTKVSSVAVAADSSNSNLGFKVTVTDNNNVPKSGSFRPKIQYGTGNDQTTVDFTNSVATLDIYTKDQVDSILQVLNAMTYRGTLGTGGSAGDYIDTTTRQVIQGSTPVPVSIGDTFLTTEDMTYRDSTGTDVDVPQGSLFIARGTEGADGYITAASLEYDIVKATKDTDTTYRFVANGTNTGVVLRNSQGVSVGEITFASGDAWLSVSRTNTDLGTTGGIRQDVVVTHQNVTRTDTTAASSVSNTVASPANSYSGSVSIPVITAVNSDAKGHITGIETTTYNLSDTNSHITSIGYTTEARTNNSTGVSVGSITERITAQYGGTGATNYQEQTYILSSKSLKIQDDDTQAKTSTDSNLASGLNIEMLWGSF